MKIIVDLLGFRQEVEVSASIFKCGVVDIPIRTLLLYNYVYSDIGLRFEFRGYEDSIPFFMLDSRQLKQIHEALGAK